MSNSSEVRKILIDNGVTGRQLDEINSALDAISALASTPSPAQPTDANVPLEEGPATIRMMPESPETSKRHWSMYCEECGIEEGMADSAAERWLIERVHAHNHEMHPEHRLAPSPVQGADVRLAGLRVAMLGTTDGGFIDDDDEIPAGEMYRLAAEYMSATYPQSPQATLNEEEGSK